MVKLKKVTTVRGLASQMLRLMEAGVTLATAAKRVCDFHKYDIEILKQIMHGRPEFQPVFQLHEMQQKRVVLTDEEKKANQRGHAKAFADRKRIKDANAKAANKEKIYRSASKETEYWEKRNPTKPTLESLF